jgi:hypothetical protein
MNNFHLLDSLSKTLKNEMEKYFRMILELNNNNYSHLNDLNEQIVKVKAIFSVFMKEINKSKNI